MKNLFCVCIGYVLFFWLTFYKDDKKKGLIIGKVENILPD